MKIFRNFFLLPALLLPFVAFAQTNVGGTYFSNQSWTIAGSPYTVTSDFQMAPGFTLSIDSSVQVYFNANTEILIQGGIQALGTPAHPIVFHGGGAKNVLHFMDADLSYSHLTSCEMIGGDNTVLMDGSCSDIASMENMLFSNAKIFQNRALGGRISIHDSRLDNVLAESQLDGSGSGYLVIEASQITNSTFKGIPLNGFVPLLILSSNLTNCHFQTVGNTSIFTALALQGDTIRDSYFHSSYATGNINGCLIVDSEFSNNGFTQQNHLVYDISNSHIINTDFVGGTILGNQWVSILEFNNCLIEKTNATIMTFDDARFTNSSVLGDGTGTGVRATYLNATRSLFKWHDVGIHFGHTFLPVNLSIDHCNIWGNNQYNAICDTTYGADAQGTWWGTSDSLTIFTKILDYYDNLLHGEIVLGNWPASPDTNAPMSPPGGLTGIPGNGFHTISWDPNPEGDLMGYRMHVGTTDGYVYAQSFAIGNVTSYDLPDSLYNQGFAVTAHDQHIDGFQDQFEGNESGFARLAGHITGVEPVTSAPKALDLQLFPNPARDHAT
ncbi:MAG TPA: hypothetical protein VHS96_14610, partial [Bacteroidia bacterium]|nr:hypothetical protein [Bacteroidia bacterium]